MAQAKTLSQAELDQVLNYVGTKKYALRDRPSRDFGNLFRV